jgi:hypothetical protein
MLMQKFRKIFQAFFEPQYSQIIINQVNWKEICDFLYAFHTNFDDKIPSQGLLDADSW